jgi:tetratricopeptide (TPR) repeat protein
LIATRKFDTARADLLAAEGACARAERDPNGEARRDAATVQAWLGYLALLEVQAGASSERLTDAARRFEGSLALDGGCAFAARGLFLVRLRQGAESGLLRELAHEARRLERLRVPEFSNPTALSYGSRRREAYLDRRSEAARRISESPLDATAFFDRATLAADWGHLPLAIADVTSALELDPFSAEPRLLRARLTATTKPAEALKDCDEGLVAGASPSVTAQLLLQKAEILAAKLDADRSSLETASSCLSRARALLPRDLPIDETRVSEVEVRRRLTRVEATLRSPLAPRSTESGHATDAELERSASSSALRQLERLRHELRGTSPRRTVAIWESVCRFDPSARLYRERWRVSRVTVYTILRPFVRLIDEGFALARSPRDGDPFWRESALLGTVNPSYPVDLNRVFNEIARDDSPADREALSFALGAFSFTKAVWKKPNRSWNAEGIAALTTFVATVPDAGVAYSLRGALHLFDARAVRGTDARTTDLDPADLRAAREDLDRGLALDSGGFVHFLSAMGWSALASQQNLELARRREYVAHALDDLERSVRPGVLPDDAFALIVQDHYFDVIRNEPRAAKFLGPGR